MIARLTIFPRWAQGSNEGVLDAYAQHLVDTHALDDTFYIVDLGAVERLHKVWEDEGADLSYVGVLL